MTTHWPRTPISRSLHPLSAPPLRPRARKTCNLQELSIRCMGILHDTVRPSRSPPPRTVPIHCIDNFQNPHALHRAIICCHCIHHVVFWPPATACLFLLRIHLQRPPLGLCPFAPDASSVVSSPPSAIDRLSDHGYPAKGRKKQKRGDIHGMETKTRSIAMQLEHVCANYSTRLWSGKTRQTPDGRHERHARISASVHSLLGTPRPRARRSSVVP